jgi:Ca-activated chloride channel family protein
MLADSSAIDNIFQNLNLDQLANYSNLPSLLGNGIDFMKNNGNEGSLILISNSDQVGDYNVANDLIDDLMNLMNPVFPINVVDYQNQNYNYYWFGNRSYYGNEYFYSNITRLTGGNYSRILYTTNSLSDVMSMAFQSLSGMISSFDLHTKLQDGFCYGRYSLNTDVSSVYLNKPILQVGKFIGNLPFIVEASGVFNSTPFSQTFTLSEEEILVTDTLSKEAWTGNYIKYLEGQNQTNDVVDEIVNNSIRERVLSVYSAFLCLEPGRGGEVCYDCYDESDLPIDVSDSVETEIESVLLSAYPNPFNSQITLNVKLPGLVNTENLTFRIYDILGQAVKTFDPDLTSGQKEYRFMWDGKNDDGYSIASGIYFFIVTTPEKNYSVKLLLMK